MPRKRVSKKDDPPSSSEDEKEEDEDSEGEVPLKKRKNQKGRIQIFVIDLIQLIRSTNKKH